MRALTLAVVLLCGCTQASRPSSVTDEVFEAMSTWQRELLTARSLEMEWGATGKSGYERLGNSKSLSGAEANALKDFFAKPLGQRQTLCLVHIDAAVRAGSRLVELCFGCGAVIVDHEEWHSVDKTAMKAFFTAQLGARPPEPNYFEGY